jgi:hypothetical protein
MDLVVKIRPEQTKGLRIGGSKYLYRGDKK